MSAQIRRFIAWSIYFTIIALYGFSLWSVFEHRLDQTFWSWAETARIVKYSTLQAVFSATLATFIGILAARSFFYLSFKGKSQLYRLITFVWALPSLIVIFALIGVWGNSGWLATLFSLIGSEMPFSLYGLQGIVFAHLFLNVPLVMKYCLEGLSLISSSTHQLAAQLNLKGWHYFRIVEWPVLGGILPYAFGTVFLLCFTSFPIVLMLGGGPKYSTLEVAIYQAVVFEFDFAKAVILILVQIMIGILLQTVMTLLSRKALQSHRHKTALDAIWRPELQGVKKWLATFFLGLLSFMMIIPLANVVWNGIVAINAENISSQDLWRSTAFSLLLSFIAAITAVSIAYGLALEIRQQMYRQHKIRQHLLNGAIILPLVLPVFLLSVGLFLLFIAIDLSQWQLMLLVGIINGLTLLPFVYHLLFPSMWQSLNSGDKLARSLGLYGFRRWWIVEKKVLIRPLIQAFALAFSTSIGHFSVIAFFGSPEFSTLPYLLYRQLGNYRIDDAAVSALFLLLCALLPFLLVRQKEIL